MCSYIPNNVLIGSDAQKELRRRIKRWFLHFGVELVIGSIVGPALYAGTTKSRLSEK